MASTVTLNKTLTAAGNSFSVSGNITVTLTNDTTRVEESYTKDIRKIKVPRVKTKQAAQTASTRFIDLKQIIKTWIIHCELTDDATVTADTKRQQLAAMLEQGGTMTFNFRGATYTVNMEKLSFDDTDYARDATFPDATLNVKLSCVINLIEGTDR